MTRRHYTIIAAALKSTRPDEAAEHRYAQWESTVLRLTDALQTTNPGFRRDTFLEACGLARGSGWDLESC